MTRGAHLIPEIDRLALEVQLALKTLVLPGWLGPQHGLPNSLYGYIMGVFSRLDLMSAYWRGSFATQSVRLVDFMTTYIQPDRRINSILVQVWRHKLMHTSSPRELLDEQAALTYRWLLQWGDDHLPRDQHMKFQPNGQNLNLSLVGLIEDLRRAASEYLAEMRSSPTLEANYDKVELELNTYSYRVV